MLIASSSTVVNFHDFPSNQLAYSYQPIGKNEGSCRSLSWTKDGCWLAVVPHCGRVQIVTLKGQCKLIHTVNEVVEATCASFQTLTKRNVAVGTQDGQVLLYDVKTKAIKGRYPRASSTITHVGYTIKDSHCYAGCANGEVLLYSHTLKSLSATFRVPKSRTLTALKSHPQKRNYFIAGSTEGIVCVWDLNVNKVKFQTEAHNGPITATVFSPVNSSLAVTSGFDQQVGIYDVDAKKRISTIEVEHSVVSLDFLENAVYIAMGAANGQIHIYDSRKLQEPVYTYQAHESSVKHLIHQNSLQSTRKSGNSSLSISSEDVAVTTETNANSMEDSAFLALALSPEAPKETSPKQPSLVEDSFLRDLSLVNLLHKPEIDAKPNSRLSARKSVTFTPTHVTRFIDKSTGQTSSTPTSVPEVTTETYNRNELGEFSPIVSDKEPSSQQTLERVDAVFKAELKEAIEEAKSHLTAYVHNKAQDIRCMVVDTRMKLINATMMIEEKSDAILNVLSATPLSHQENRLLRENEALWKMAEEQNKKLHEKEKQLEILKKRLEELGFSN